MPTPDTSCPAPARRLGGNPEPAGAPLDWDDLRVFHAVAECGSLSRAAQALRVTQPTVGRRVRALERRLGARLFDRLSAGYRMTAAGTEVYARCGPVAEAIGQIARRVRGEDDAVAGAVRVTASEGIGASWLAPRLGALRARRPLIDVRLELSTATRDLAAGEADIALRMGEPGDETLVGRRIASIPFRLFASRAYVARHGAPRGIEDLRRHMIIESAGRLENVPQARLLRELAAGAPTVAALDNIFGHLASVRAGIGLVGLPCYMGGHEPDLLPVLPEHFAIALPVWLLTRSDLRTVARVRAVLDFIASEAAESLPQA